MLNYSTAARLREIFHANNVEKYLDLKQLLSITLEFTQVITLTDAMNAVTDS